MAGSRLTGFEQVLIGLIFARPRSGYDLKRHFASTPASVYQPSSGALYPALRRLEHHGLLQQVPQDDDQGDGTHRRRRVYQVTAQGRAAHAAWIREPVNPATVSQDLGMHLMRFAMMEGQLPRADVLAFLSSLQAALADFVAGIERFLASFEARGQHGPLALEHGVAVHRASLDWTARAMAALTTSDGTLRGPEPAGAPSA
jgi:DNA-binding PadR family transcriptional regulator